MSGECPICVKYWYQQGCPQGDDHIIISRGGHIKRAHDLAGGGAGHGGASHQQGSSSPSEEKRLQAEVNRLNSELGSLRLEMNRSEWTGPERDSSFSSKEKRLHDEVERLNSELGSVRGEKNQLDSEVKRLRDDNGRLNSELGSLQADLSTYKAKAAKLKIQLKNSEKQVSHLEAVVEVMEKNNWHGPSLGMSGTGTAQSGVGQIGEIRIQATEVHFGK